MKRARIPLMILVLSLGQAVAGERALVLREQATHLRDRELVVADGETIDGLLQDPTVRFAAPVIEGGDGWQASAPELLVRTRPEFAERATELISELAPDLAVVSTDVGGLRGVLRLRSSERDGRRVVARAERLANDPRLVWAEPDWIVGGRGGATIDDPGYAYLWGLENLGQSGGVPGVDMNVDAAWQTTTGSAAVRVLVIDTGVEQSHPDLNQLPGMDFTDEGPGDGGPVNECDRHGTWVAGCVSAIADNALGTSGVAPDVLVISARTFVSTPSCDGNWTSQSSWTVDALGWASANGVRVTNNSNGYGTGAQSQAIADAYAATRSAGMVHFASAMNNAQSAPGYPASLPSVLAVSNVMPDGTLNPSSNYGPGLALAGPGTSIYSTDLTGELGGTPFDYAFVTGTSFASPYAAGIAALLVSVEPSLTATEVESRLFESARDLGTAGFDSTYGHGLVDAEAALIPPGVDLDADGADDRADNCRGTSNPSQADSDGDGVGDACDLCPVDALDDADSDGVCASADTCPSVNDPVQADSDSDGVGDACQCAAPRLAVNGVAPFDAFGASVAWAGDVDDDGVVDWIAGLPGADIVGFESGRAGVFSGSDGSLLFILNGEAARDEFGSSVDGAGDVDGDGFDDVIVGAPNNDGGGPDAGRAYVFRGGPGPYPIVLGAVDAWHVITGESTRDELGGSVAGIGDADGDGVGDLLVGAALWDSGGRAYVHSGASGALLHTLGPEGASESFGFSVAGASDLDGDGRADVVVGAPLVDRVFAFSGASGALLETYDGSFAHGQFGFAVVAVPDSDGDGADELLVGAPRDGTTAPDAGSASLVSGAGGGVIHVWFGDEPVDRLGQAVGVAGDRNGDGLPDLWIGVPRGAVAGRVRPGRVLLMSGADGSRLLALDGDVHDDRFGAALDGASELVVGAARSAVANPFAGRAAVHGPVFALPATVDSVWWLDATTIAWGAAGTTGYDLVRGGIAELPVGGAGEQCLAPGDGAMSTVDDDEPQPGEGYYYLVRGRNECGPGSYGSSTDGVPRSTVACP